MSKPIFISTKQELVKLVTDSQYSLDCNLSFSRIAKMPSRYYVNIYINNTIHMVQDIRCTDNIVELVEPITDLSDNGMAPFSLLIPYLTRGDKIDKLLGT